MATAGGATNYTSEKRKEYVAARADIFSETGVLGEYMSRGVCTVSTVAKMNCKKLARAVKKVF